MKRRALSLSLEGWFLATLLPVLGVLVVVYATHIYLRLSHAIMAGFDEKLTAVSTAAAAFIDPADYQRLTEPLPIGSMSHVLDQQAMLALDLKRREILKIRTTDGVAVSTGIRVPPGVDEFSAGLTPDELFLIDAASGTFFRMNKTTGAVAKAFEIAPPIAGAGTWVEKGWIYVGGRALRRYDVRRGQLDVLAPALEPIRDIEYDANHGELLALTADGDELLHLDPNNGAVRRRVRLKILPPAAAGITPKPVPLSVTTIAYEPISGKTFGTSTTFLRIDPETGIASSEGFQPSFGQEQGPIYRKYAVPMQHIMQRAKLTYLYTQSVQARNRITYGIDGTVGSSHSPLLSTDTLPDEETGGVQRLLTEGTVYISGVQSWQQWGLLKSAFAPIFDQAGRPIAMAGADVDVSIIQFQTRKALVIAFSFGALMLVLGGVLTFSVARRVTGPLDAIKTAALRAASNDFACRVEVARPRELTELARQFTAAAADLGTHMQQLSETISKQRVSREREALVERLAGVPPLVSAGPEPARWAWGGLGPEVLHGELLGGAVQRGETVLLWLAPATGDFLSLAARRATLATTADALLARHGPDFAALGAALEPLFKPEIAAWAVITAEGCRVLLRSAILIRRDTDGRCRREAAVSFGVPLRPRRDEVLVLTEPEAASACESYLESLRRIPPADELVQALAQHVSIETRATFALVSVGSAAS